MAANYYIEKTVAERHDVLKRHSLRREGIWGPGRGGSGDPLAEVKGAACRARRVGAK
jgi:hypothetical protein